MAFSDLCNQIFAESIRDYHLRDEVDTPLNNP